MCQCICCDCWWCNLFGVCCGGLHLAACIFSCWICKPELMKQFDAECCHICACDGCGGNMCFSGQICCAPSPVKQWSSMVRG